MSYNGSGTFVINSAGTPYTSGTVISSNAANSLNSDLATGLSTAICKDGQSTPTANIGLGGFKITNLGAGTVASDAARLSQVQNSGTTTLISITGTDTITGTVSPTLSGIYVTGQVFSFVVAATNTGAVTLNIDSQGAKAVTRTGAVALVAGDMVTGQVAIVEYDGTRFQLINGNSFTNLKVSGTLGVTGVATLGNGAILGTPASGTVTNLTGTASININGTVGATTPATGSFTTLSTTGNVSVANGSVYGWGAQSAYMGGSSSTNIINFLTSSTERMRIDSSGNVGIATNSPGAALHVFGNNGNFGFNSFFGLNSSTAGIGIGNNATIGLIQGAASATSATTANIALQASGGSVIVGDTTVINNGKINSVFDQTTASGMGFKNTNATATGYFCAFYNSSAVLQGSIQQTSSSITLFATTSDYRLKNTIKPMLGALDKVALLKPVTYKWNADGSDGQGFIAHELQAVVPECVTGEKDEMEIRIVEVSPAISAVFDNEGIEILPAKPAVTEEKTYPKYQNIDTGFLVATLTAAIQELKAIIDTQAARITALETR